MCLPEQAAHIIFPGCVNRMPDPWRFCKAGQLLCGKRDQNLVLTREEVLGADYCQPGELVKNPHSFWFHWFSGCLFLLLSTTECLSPSKTTTNGVLCPVYPAETRHQMGHPSPELGESLFQMAKWNIAKYACKVFEHSVTDRQNKQRWGESRINNSWGKAAFLWMLQPCSSLCLRRHMEMMLRAGNKTERLWGSSGDGHCSSAPAGTVPLSGSLLTNMTIWL